MSLAANKLELVELLLHAACSWVPSVHVACCPSVGDRRNYCSYTSGINLSSIRQLKLTLPSYNFVVSSCCQMISSIVLIVVFEAKICIKTTDTNNLWVAYCFKAFVLNEWDVRSITYDKSLPLLLVCDGFTKFGRVFIKIFVVSFGTLVTYPRAYHCLF